MLCGYVCYPSVSEGLRNGLYALSAVCVAGCMHCVLCVLRIVCVARCMRCGVFARCMRCVGAFSYLSLLC